MRWPYPWNKNINPLVIPPGYCRFQVSVQMRSTTKDGGGDSTETWTDALTALAGITTQTQREAYQNGAAAQLVEQVVHIVTFRYPTPAVTIAGGMRVIFGARKFAVQTTENVQERNRVLHLMCLEVNEGAGCS